MRKVADEQLEPWLVAWHKDHHDGWQDETLLEAAMKFVSAGLAGFKRLFQRPRASSIKPLPICGT